MIKNLVLAAFCLLLVCSADAQKSPIKFGEIPMSDMQMTTYDLDSSAAAVILADYGEAYVNITAVSAQLIFERHVRIKILKKDGLKWANVGVQLYHSGSSAEKLMNLKASTYNIENNKIVETKMSKDDVFKEKFNRNFDVQKFTLPNVKEGSVIEYSYKVNSEFLVNFPNWQFQYEIPVRVSEYWAIIPEFFIMSKYMQGYVTTTSYEEKDRAQGTYSEKAHHWVIKNVPAFKEEPFMTTENDYQSKINFALAYINFPGRPAEEIMGSWQKLNKDLLEDESFGKTISGSGFLKKKVEELVGSEIDEMKKVEIIYNYVKETLEWDGTQDIFADDNLKAVFEKKQGTTADINLSLASMLEKAGLVVDMVLVSTRDHGFVREQYPMRSQFNYVVCAVRINGVPMFLDATEKYLPLGVLPERCLNGQGLIISKNFHGWIKLESKTKARTVINADLVLNETSELKGNVSFIHDGYDGLSMRKKYQSNGEDDYVKNSVGTRSSWQIEKTVFENLSEPNKSVKESHDLVITDHLTIAGDIMYLNPFIAGQLMENPFTLEERTYPVDYGSLKEKVYMCKVTIPEGYSIDELPKSKVIALPGFAAKYTYSVASVGNTINIVSNFQINRTLFGQTEYPNLREFYNQVVSKQAEQIVLKKN